MSSYDKGQKCKQGAGWQDMYATRGVNYWYYQISVWQIETDWEVGIRVSEIEVGIIAG